MQTSEFGSENWATRPVLIHNFETMPSPRRFPTPWSVEERRLRRIGGASGVDGEAPAKQSGPSLTVSAALLRYPFYVGAVSQPTIQVSNHFLCDGRYATVSLPPLEL